MQSILKIGEIYAFSMAFGTVCSSLQTTWLIYILKIIKRLLIMFPIINQRILNRLIIDISINRPIMSDSVANFSICLTSAIAEVEDFNQDLADLELIATCQRHSHYYLGYLIDMLSHLVLTENDWVR